jgi:predicted dienelactone hydrolase
MIQRKLKLAARLAMGLISLAILAWLLILVQRSRVVTLPAPGGPYPVGRLITTWTDGERQETLGGPPGLPRRISVWIWYPAESGGAALPYMPTEWAHARQAERGIGSLLFQAVGSIHDHATDSGLTSRGEEFPVLVMEPGLGLLIPEFTTLAEDLASQGYVVIGLNPTYSASITVLDGQVVKQSDLGNIPEDASLDQFYQRGDELVTVWAADDRFTIDQVVRMDGDPSSLFAGRLDTHHIGLLGHSFGGAAALEACHLDERCSAAADLDGTSFGSVASTGLDRPVMLMLSASEDQTGSPILQKSSRDLETIFNQSRQSYQIVIRGALHFNFSDYAVEFMPLGRPLGILGSIDGVRGLQIASAYLAGFFNQTLKGQPSPLLQGTSSDYPEVQITSHHP